LRSDISLRLRIRPISEAPANSIDSWRNTGGYWERHTDKLNFAKFHLDWFEELASRMCVKNPIQKVDDLLFDYPALDSFIQMAPDFDIVVINSPGLSGQFTNFNPDDFRVLVSKLVSKGHRVISTVATGLCPAFDGKNVTWIGATAAKAKAVIGTSTGPSWPGRAGHALTFITKTPFICSARIQRQSYLPNAVRWLEAHSTLFIF